MNFWERVDELLEKNEINKKTLAYEAGFDASNITKGIKNGNVPSAETAVKIAKVLNVSVEYLVTGKNNLRDDFCISQQSKNLNEQFSKLSEKGKRIVLALVKEIQNENI